MSQNIDNFLCSNCQGDQYYEDNQGNIICNYCGIQSQDYIAESHEAHEEGMLFQQGHSIRRHTFLSAKAKSQKQEYEPELLDYLIVYQYSLQMIGNSAFQLSMMQFNDLHKENHHQRETETEHLKSFQATLKSLWIRYLEAWKDSNSGCRMSFAFHSTETSSSSSSKSSIHCYCPTEKLDHPLFPAKPLLLGFVYLAIRLHRLEIIIPDIIRWVERGLLPYVALWDAFPDGIKVYLHPQHRKVFNQQSSLPHGVITPMNIWFHTCSLADCLGIVLPPLNGPLVGYSMIYSLGLPPEVKINFSKLTQLFTTAVPLTGADLSSEHYVEYIMAVIILSCLMTKDWLTWNYVCHTDYLLTVDKGFDRWSKEQGTKEAPEAKGDPSGLYNCIPAPVRSHQFSTALLSRRFLCTYLQQVAKTLPKEQHTGNSFQDVFEETFNSLSIEERKSIHYIQQFQTTFKSSTLYLSQQYSFEENIIDEESDKYAQEKDKQQNRKDLSYLYELFAVINPTAFKKMKEKTFKKKKKRKTSSSHSVKTGDQFTSDQFQVRYATPFRYKGHDVTGHPLLQYTILVERCAKYLYITPVLLDIILQTFDLQILQLLLFGSVTTATRKHGQQETTGDAPFTEHDDLSEHSENNESNLNDVESLARRSKYYQNNLQKNPIYEEQEVEIIRLGTERQEEVFISNKIPWQMKAEMLEMRSYREDAEFNFPLIARLIQLEEKKTQDGNNSKLNGKNQSKQVQSIWNYDEGEDWWRNKKVNSRSVQFKEVDDDIIIEDEANRRELEDHMIHDSDDDDSSLMEDERSSEEDVSIDQALGDSYNIKEISTSQSDRVLPSSFQPTIIRVPVKPPNVPK